MFCLDNCTDRVAGLDLPGPEQFGLWLDDNWDDLLAVREAKANAINYDLVKYRARTLWASFQAFYLAFKAQKYQTISLLESVRTWEDSFAPIIALESDLCIDVRYFRRESALDRALRALECIVREYKASRPETGVSVRDNLWAKVGSLRRILASKRPRPGTREVAKIGSHSASVLEELFEKIGERGPDTNVFNMTVTIDQVNALIELLGGFDQTAFIVREKKCKVNWPYLLQRLNQRVSWEDDTAKASYVHSLESLRRRLLQEFDIEVAGTHVG
jgi:hypothetical protein